VRIHLLLCMALLLSACGDSRSPTEPSRTSIRLEAYSAGYKVRQNGSVAFSKDYVQFYGKSGGAGGGRGFNVALLDKKGNLSEPVRAFDTWAGPHRELVDFLTGIPNGAVVMLAIADEAGITAADSCDASGTIVNALVALGSTRIRDYCFRGSWSMIVVKGEGVKSEQLSNSNTGVESVYELPL
jgi:hypothetical protein